MDLPNLTWYYIISALATKVSWYIVTILNPFPTFN